MAGHAVWDRAWGGVACAAWEGLEGLWSWMAIHLIGEDWHQDTDEAAVCLGVVEEAHVQHRLPNVAAAVHEHLLPRAIGDDLAAS